jgi:hypothetical protein
MTGIPGCGLATFPLGGNNSGSDAPCIIIPTENPGWEYSERQNSSGQCGHLHNLNFLSLAHYFGFVPFIFDFLPLITACEVFEVFFHSLRRSHSTGTPCSHTKSFLVGSRTLEEV